MIGYQVATGAGVIGLGAGAAVFMVCEKKNQQVQAKELTLFSVIFVVLIFLSGFTGLLGNWPLLSVFILDQLYFLLIGFLFSHFFHKRFSIKLNKPLISEALCMIATVAIGIFFFIFLYDRFHDPKLGYYFSTSVIVFFLPFLIRESYLRYFAIPEENYKSWEYPGDYAEPDLGGKDFNSGPRVFVELLETENSLKRIPSNAPANPNLKLGDWFFLVLRDFEGVTVAIRNSNSEPYRWHLYRKPSIFRFRRYLDTDLTIRENQIDKGFIIIAERVKADKDKHE